MRLILISLLLSTALPSWAADDPNEVRVFVDALKDADPSVRRTAVLAISKNDLGVEALPYLVEATGDSDPNVRQAAVQALGGLKSKSTLPISALVKRIKDPSESIRAAAFDGLGAIGKDARVAIPALLQALKTDDINSQVAIVRALGQIGANADSAVPSLLSLIGQTDRCDLVEVALDAIKKMQSDVTETLRTEVVTAAVNQLRSPCSNTKVSALNVLDGLTTADNLSPEAINNVINSAENKDENIRYAAINVIAQVPDLRARAVLAKLASADPDYIVRSRAVNHLNGQSEFEEIAALLEALDDPAASVRADVVDRFVDVQVGKRNVCSELARRVTDRATVVRRKVAERLGMCGEWPSAMGSALLTAASDQDSEVRARGLSSIGQVFGKSRWQSPEKVPATDVTIEKAIQSTIDHLEDPDSDVRSAASTSLLRLAPLPDSNIPAIVAATQSDYSDTRAVAIQLLGSFGKAAWEAVSDRISEYQVRAKEGDDALQTATLETLGLVSANATPVIATLTEALDWAESSVRGVAAESLGRFGSDAAPSLNKLVESLHTIDRDDASSVYWALAGIGDPAVQRLRSALQQALAAPPSKPANALVALLTTDDRIEFDKALKSVLAIRTTADLDLLNVSGKREKVTASSRNVVIGMATWCPHSAALAQLLKNPNIRRLTAGWTLNFVFGDEWPYVRKALDDEVKAGNITAIEANNRYEELKKRSGNKLVYDPTFFEGLPGKVYFHTGVKGEPQPESYPLIFVPNEHKYSQDASAFAREGLRLPAWILRNVDW